VLALKGAALSALHYRDDGVRPMDDVDLLVRTRQAGPALDVLAAEGWTPATTLPREAFLAVRHAEAIARPDGTRIDLHWNALRQPGPDDAFWDASVETTAGGEPVRALCATDELLHACVHGAAWDAFPSVRWAADALILLGEGAIDWDRLTREARARRLTSELAGGLGYLRERFGAAVPVAVVDALRSSPRRLHERLGYRASRSAPSPFGTLCLMWDRYRRLRELDTSLPRPRSFLSYAARASGFERRVELVPHAVRSLARR
jgi:hypothetical protein